MIEKFKHLQIIQVKDDNSDTAFLAEQAKGPDNPPHDPKQQPQGETSFPSI